MLPVPVLSLGVLVYRTGTSIIHRPSMVAQGFQRVKPLNGRQLHSQRRLDVIDEAIGYY